MKEFIYAWLSNRAFLWLLFVVNIVGSVYGYYWYKEQLIDTQPIFLLFVPDSPTASLFFTFVLLAFLMGKNWSLMEAFAIVTLFKYGIWAVVMNILTLVVSGTLHWTGYMLIASHLAMAVQGLLYAPFYRFKWWHLAIAGVWTLHNDVIDYVYMQYPRYRQLELYIQEIGYFTFWLSILSLFIAYWFCIRRVRSERSLRV
ncbi:DUF1405 domain-containing protein [Jeotgalibacillus soli]|uniref:DUF1405 domain-containing protein n=1 Tax=Jeotgalibacillus soli TaxID=889306 RepID=A0A0C2VJL2_9BACL|nr:DUF1405 domain-containing protein [Jeotgalibacillus soli]KIL44188.1 hypothetical protein KP78_31520 [Jeotgalibacillus soli]